MRSYQRLTLNLTGAKTRHDQLEGRNYLVVPTVMISEGVWAGSQGPLYYPPEELAKNPGVWNHKPVMLYHPTLNGEGVSACTPAVLDSQKCGLLLNTVWDGRLRTESWLDEEKLKRLDNRVLEALNRGESVEVSTGLYHDPEPKPGIWNNKPYVGVVHNIQPDHLAILPDQKGACSVDDGAGLLRNAAAAAKATAELSFDEIRQQISASLRDDRKGPKVYNDDYSYVCEVYPKYAIYDSGGPGGDKCFKIGYKVRSGKVILEGEPEQVRKVTSYIAVNGETQPLTNAVWVAVGNDDQTQGPLKLPKPAASQLSDVMRKQQMQRTLEAKYSGVQQEGDWGGWVTDLFANYVVWSKDGKLFKLPYTYDDDKINFDGEPEEVERVSEYRSRRTTPIDGTTSPYNVNSSEPPMPPAQNAIHQGAHDLMHMPATGGGGHNEPGKSDGQTRTQGRKDMVNKMISAHGWGESDRAMLEGMPDDHFASVAKYTMKGATQPVVPYTYDGISDRSSVHAASTQVNQNAQPQTVEQFLQTAPPAIRQVLLNGMAAEAAQKQGLVKNVLASPTNVFTEAWLMQLDLPQLQGMAALAGGQTRRVNNYAGQASVPMFNEAALSPQTNNQYEDAVLPLPDMFAPAQKTA